MIRSQASEGAPGWAPCTMVRSSATELPWKARDVFDSPLTLEGDLIRLEPLAPRHVPALMRVARASPAAFALTNTPLTDEEERRYFERAFRDRDAGTGYPFVVLLREHGTVVGTTRFNHLELAECRCDIGYTWIDPAYQRTGVNREAKRLMLGHAFEVLGVNRVQFQTDERNLRSCRALERLGAKREGVLRMHAIARDGFPRNSVIYSVIAPEWPAVKEALEGASAASARASEA